MENDNLTEREWEVLEKLANEKRNKTIAADLYISVNTVEYHLKSIFRKIEVESRVAAARWYWNKVQRDHI